MTLLVLGTVFVLVCALSLDWVIDRLEISAWIIILKKGEGYTFKKGWDKFYERLSLFNSGYFLLSVCIAGLSFVILLQGLYKLASPQTEMFTLSLIFSGLWSLYIVFQMMTKNLGKIIFALIALGVVIGSVLITIFT